MYILFLKPGKKKLKLNVHSRLYRFIFIFFRVKMKQIFFFFFSFLIKARRIYKKKILETGLMSQLLDIDMLKMWP
jgi:hypothetical protein